jgi:hypothetical protein
MYARSNQFHVIRHSFHLRLNQSKMKRALEEATASLQTAAQRPQSTPALLSVSEFFQRSNQTSGAAIAFLGVVQRALPIERTRGTGAS